MGLKSLPSQTTLGFCDAASGRAPNHFIFIFFPCDAEDKEDFSFRGVKLWLLFQSWICSQPELGSKGRIRNKPKHSQDLWLMVKPTHLPGLIILKSPEQWISRNPCPKPRTQPAQSQAGISSGKSAPSQAQPLEPSLHIP